MTVDEAIDYLKAWQRDIEERGVGTGNDAIAVLVDEIERLRAIVERLPLTVDGVRVVPYSDTIWVTCWPYDDGPIRGLSGEYFVCVNGRWYVQWGGPHHDAVPVSECFSSEAAMRKEPAE